MTCHQLLILSRLFCLIVRLVAAAPLLMAAGWTEPDRVLYFDHMYCLAGGAISSALYLSVGSDSRSWLMGTPTGALLGPDMI